MGLLTQSGDLFIWRGPYQDNETPKRAGFEWEPLLRRWVTHDRERAATLWRHSLPPLRDQLRPAPQEPKQDSPPPAPPPARASVKSTEKRKARGKSRPCGYKVVEGSVEPFLASMGGITCKCSQCGERTTAAHSPEINGVLALVCGRCCPHCEES